MIKVGFLLNFPVEYKGGINYLKNLFYAVKKFKADEVQIILFVPSNLDEEYISLFENYVFIVKTKVLQRKTLPWFFSRIGEKVFKFDLLINNLLKKHKIDVVSHSNYVFPNNEIKSVNWIPDFQYLHYPHLWTKKQLRSEHKAHSNWTTNSNRIVVSSYDALKDLLSVYPGSENKVSVLHFVSQPDILKHKSTIDISKYVIGKYFYLPNQFWEHKNHITVFKAVKFLKDKGINIQVLTSGLMNDFRNKNQHVEMLKNYISLNDLREQIKFLGLIPYVDVLMLIRSSVAVINPSFFEGWSSTVEEAKSIGKSIVLSDIPVHREQDPKDGFFFDPNNEIQLAELLENLLNNSIEIVDPDFEEQALINLDIRTKEFATKYVSILKEIL